MASASVGLPTTSYQRSTGTWLVMISDPAFVAILDDFQQVAALLGGQRLGPQSSKMSRLTRASWRIRRP